MSEIVRVGIVGLGHMGQKAHLANYLQSPGCEVVAVADMNNNLRAAVQKRFSIENSYSSHIELLESCEIDALVVVTDREATLDVARDALLRGKHVFTEKPIGLSLESAKLVVDLADLNNLVYKIGYMRQYDKAVIWFRQEFRKQRETSELGKIVFIRVHCLDSIASYAGGFDTIKYERDSRKLVRSEQTPKWLPHQRQTDYLYFLNAFCHHINLMNWILEEDLAGDEAEIIHTDFKDMRLRTAKLKFSSANVMFELGRGNSLNQDEYIEVFYEYGVLKLELPPNMLRDKPGRVLKKRFLNSTQNEETIDFGYDWAFRNQAIAFLQDIREKNTNCINSGKSSLLDLYLIEKLWKHELQIID